MEATSQPHDTDSDIVQPVIQAQGLHAVAAGLLVASTALMLYAGNMAGSTALFACAALFISDIAIGTNIRALGATSRTRAGTATALVAAVLAVWTLAGIPHQFSDMAFVSGLLVALVSVPVLLINFIAGRILRRPSASVADLAVYKRSKIRLAAMVITLAAGYQAFNSFSAIPDVLVTVPIVALAVMNVISVIRNRAVTGSRAVAPA